jgi:metal-dependent amidase/aminoacylase/carboxypeptidase family protein
MTALARHAARAVVGGENVRTLSTANMGGEDFACYLEQVPGCFVRIGGAPAGRLPHAAHSDRFDFHEAAIAVGAAWLADVARRVP